jgi:hypothetical protein
LYSLSCWGFFGCTFGLFPLGLLPFGLFPLGLLPFGLLIHRVDQMQHYHFSRVDQVGIDQVGIDQVGINQVGVDQMGVDQVGIDQVGVDQMGVDRICPFECFQWVYILIVFMNC